MMIMFAIFLILVFLVLGKSYVGSMQMGSRMNDLESDGIIQME